MREGLRSAWRRAVLLPAAAAMAVLAAGCDQGQPQASQQKAPPPVPAVTVSKPAQRQIVEWDEYTGRFDAVHMVEIRARVSGYLNEVRFKDGQQVAQGDVLFNIDPRPFERALEQSRAELFAAATKVENANLDVQRGQPLIERKIISDKVFDDRMNLLRDAQASMKVAEAKVKSAELDLSFATISAPISGRIGRALVTAGNWISAGSVARRCSPPSSARTRSTSTSTSTRTTTSSTSAWPSAASAPARPASVRRSRWRWPTSAASRTRASSTSSTTGWTRARARSGHARCSPTRPGCSRPGCSAACG
jgi:multidrug efflux pump subunit AcrA (membrane-fusion protein)